jgi:hypothetical protein
MSESSVSSVSLSSTSVCGDLVSITLTPEFQERYTLPNRKKGYRLRVEASAGCNIVNEIFRYFQHPPLPGSGQIDQEFSGVCSWPALEAFPANEPRPNDDPPTFRLDYFDIVLDDEDEATLTWNDTQEEAQELVQSIADGMVLKAGTPVTISSEEP